MCLFFAGDGERRLAGDFHAITAQGDDLARVIGEDAYAVEAEIIQNLCADAAFPLDEALAAEVVVQLATAVKDDARRLRGGFRRRSNLESAAGMMEVDKNAGTFAGDSLEGFCDEFVAIASGGGENVSGEAMGLDAGESGLVMLRIAEQEGDVGFVIAFAEIGDHAEGGPGGGEERRGNALDVAFVTHAIADEVGDGEHFEAMAAAEFEQLGDAGHGAIFIHDFADYAGMREAGDAGEVDGGLGLAGADEDAATTGAQWKDVAGASEIFRAGGDIDGGEDGGGAV